MKAVIAALLLNASTLTSPPPPPLVPSAELMPEPVEQAMPAYARWWFWTIMGVATVQTLATVGFGAFVWIMMQSVPGSCGRGGCGGSSPF